jgi:hypothetical protein
MQSIVVHLKRFKELFEHLLFGLLSCLDLRVIACVVFALDVLNIKHTVSAEIYLLERLLNKLGPELIHGTYHDPDELIKTDLPTAVDIKSLEETVDVLWVNIDLEIFNALLKLIKIKRTRVIVVHNLELPSEANESSTTSTLQLFSKSLHKDSLEFGGKGGCHGNAGVSLWLWNWLLGGIRIIASKEWITRLHLLLHFFIELFIHLNLLFFRERRVRVHGPSGEPSARALAWLVVLVRVNKRVIFRGNSAPSHRLGYRLRSGLSGSLARSLLVPLACPALLILLIGAGIALEVPGVVHHEGEVFIVVNAN